MASTEEAGYGSQAQDRRKGVAIAAVVLGLIGLIISIFLGGFVIGLVPGIFGGVLGLMAVILGFVTVRKANRGEAGGKGLAIGGIVIGVFAVLLNAAGAFALVNSKVYIDA